jgi:glutathione S-transferase
MGFATDKDEPATYREFTIRWARRHLANLDRWLEGREFIATEAFTVADILMAHALAEIKDESLLEPRPRVASYRQRCFARPAWERALESYFARVEAG